MRKLVFFIVIIILGILFWNYQTSPVDKTNKTQTIFTVANGEGIKAIAKDLQEKHLIKNADIFYLQVKFSGLENNIQAGDFSLSPSLSSMQIAKTLTHSALDIWVTIPDGRRAEEIASILQSKMPEYQDSWKESLVANEGYLFPDTYLFPRDASIDTILKIIKENFDKKYQALTITNTAMNQTQIVILASILEREGKPDVDRQIASVLINRLSLGMALQVDATVQYAVGNPSNWWPQLTDSPNNIVPNSTYNSYTHTGLPPTPICSPGLAALQAAANPANTDYLFYLADKHGNTHFSKTLQEHNANIKKYNL